jgi:hypothetical protein
MSSPGGADGAELLEIDGEPICTCGHLHGAHDVYVDAEPDDEDRAMYLACSRCACRDMTPVLLREVH